MHHRLLWLPLLALIMASLAGIGGPPSPTAAAAHEPNDCHRVTEGDYQTHVPSTGAARFRWRDERIEASVTTWQQRCSCTDRSDVVDPVTGVVVDRACIEWDWVNQPDFDRSRSPVPTTRLAFDQPRLMQLGANDEWGRVCRQPWHDTRGVTLPDYAGIGYDFRGSDQEEYHVWGHVQVNGKMVHSSGISHCEPDTLSQVRIVINDRSGTEIAIRWEERFDIAGAVQAAVAQLPYDQVQVAVSPDQRGLVGLPTYYWLTGVDQTPFSGLRVPVEGWGGYNLSAWVVTYPMQIEWRFSDGTTLTTLSRGVPYPLAEPQGPGGPAHPDAVARRFEQAGTYLTTVRITWVARWGLYEEHRTLCNATNSLYCAPFIPIYQAGPATSGQSQTYEVIEVRSVSRYRP